MNGYVKEKCVLCLITIGFIAFVYFQILGCSNGEEDAPNPQFAEKQIVESVLSGERGQVLRLLWKDDTLDHSFSKLSAWVYQVRFAIRSETPQTQTVRLDDPTKVNAFSIVFMCEFELRAAKGDD